MKIEKRNIILLTLGILIIAGSVFSVSGHEKEKNKGDNSSEVNKKELAAGNENSELVTLTDEQIKGVRFGSVKKIDFSEQYETYGYIDFNQDRNVPVFSPWQGRIVEIKVQMGALVHKGDLLFVLDSTDLGAAEAALISAAAVKKNTEKNYQRTSKLLDVQGASEKDLEQAKSDFDTAEGNYQAARDAVRIFGLSDKEVDSVIINRTVDGRLRINSPIQGRVTSRNASVGLLLEPGNSPAPITVSDSSSYWMIATVPENIIPSVKIGDIVTAYLQAYPNKTFSGKVTAISASVDSTTHTASVRAELNDSKGELFPQMMGKFNLQTGSHRISYAIPQQGVVREGDGTMSVFVTKDGKSFEHRTVNIGKAQGGMVEVISGVSEGENVVSEGAIFLSNAMALVQR